MHATDILMYYYLPWFFLFENIIMQHDCVLQVSAHNANLQLLLQIITYSRHVNMTPLNTAGYYLTSLTQTAPSSVC